MQAGENERYAGEDVAVSGFDDVRFPDELDFARQHRIRPLFVMPEDQQEIIRMFQFMSKLLKVRRYFFVCLTPRLNPMKSARLSTEVAFALLTQQPRVRIPALPFLFTA